MTRVRVTPTTPERKARREVARLLGVANLRGLAQAPTERGILFFAPGADEDGEAVEMVWGAR
jgi:hypothetical protein